MEYTLVSAGDEKTLIQKVNDLIISGWETEGGVAIGSDGTLYQAMILFDDFDDENDIAQAEEL